MWEYIFKYALSIVQLTFVIFWQSEKLQMWKKYKKYRSNIRRRIYLYIMQNRVECCTKLFLRTSTSSQNWLCNICSEKLFNIERYQHSFFFFFTHNKDSQRESCLAARYYFTIRPIIDPSATYSITAWDNAHWR